MRVSPDRAAKFPCCPFPLRSAWGFLILWPQVQRAQNTSLCKTRERTKRIYTASTFLPSRADRTPTAHGIDWVDPSIVPPAARLGGVTAESKFQRYQSAKVRLRFDATETGRRTRARP